MSYIADQPLAAADKITNRPGRFTVDGFLLDLDPAAVMVATDGVLIVRAELQHFQFRMEYTGYSAAFDRLEPGMEAPKYRCELTKHQDGTVSRRFVREA